VLNEEIPVNKYLFEKHIKHTCTVQCMSKLEGIMFDKFILVIKVVL